MSGVGMGFSEPSFSYISEWMPREISTPLTPPSGYAVIYVDSSTNNLMQITDSGRIIRVTNKTHLRIVDNSGNWITDSVGNYLYTDGSI